MHGILLSTIPCSAKSFVLLIVITSRVVSGFYVRASSVINTSRFIKLRSCCFVSISFKSFISTLAWIRFMAFDPIDIRYLPLIISISIAVHGGLYTSKRCSINKPSFYRIRTTTKLQGILPVILRC